MLTTQEMNEQVDLLIQMLDGIEDLQERIDYLVEIKDDANLTVQKQQLEAAKGKAALVIGAISRRADLLDAEHAKKFKEITG